MGGLEELVLRALFSSLKLDNFDRSLRPLAEKLDNLGPGAIGRTSMLLCDRHGSFGDSNPRGLVLEHSDDPWLEGLRIG